VVVGLLEPDVTSLVLPVEIELAQRSSRILFYVADTVRLVVVRARGVAVARLQLLNGRVAP
jgi:hypothetical protein